MADVDTSWTFAWGPAVLPPPSFTCGDDQLTQGWSMRKGTTTYSGIVTWNGSPAEFRVVLMDSDSFSVIDATVSNPSTGEWTMSNWSSSYSHLVMCLDSSGTFQSISFDRV